MIKKENLIFIEKAIQFPEVVKLVTRASERIWYKLNDVTSFEHTCYRNIGKALAEEEIKSVGGIAARIVARAEAWHTKNRSIEEIKSIESLAGLDDEGVEEPFEARDVLVDVERKVIGDSRHKEIVALLAKDDDRRKSILKAWSIGYNNESELSHVLADIFGGKASTHRIYIQRFQTECKKRMGGSLEVALAS